MHPRRDPKFSVKPSRAVATSLAFLLLAPIASTFQGGALPPSPVGPCGPASIQAGRLRPGAAQFRLEGLIQGYDTALRLITTNDCEFHVPPSVLLDVDGDALGDIDFAFAFDPVLEQQHTLLGGTVIANGHLVRGSGFCWELEADTVEILFAENVLLGPLTGVSAGDRRFVVNATNVKLNTDPRFPALLLGLGGEPVTTSDLYGFEGSLVSAVGYFENGALRATLVETAAWIPHPVFDTVIVERATWDPSKEAIDVRGYVSRRPTTNTLVPFVAVYAGAENVGGGCGGMLAGTSNVTFDPTTQLGQFRYRSPDHAFPARPSRICAQSAGGGSDDLAVE
ncbi:MAG: hypothetical protein HZA53_14275 [Planctomycetes bacterium]|nr:hypothetical protein [Planctomycetota bacterium]